MAIRIVAVLVLFAAVARADEPAQLILQSVEEKYSSEAAKADALVAKAEAEAAKIRRLAADVRLQAYKDRLVEVTKTGDFDKAAAVKARVEQLEAEPESEIEKAPKATKRPKDAVKFQGHFYALVKEPATWHVAKRRCEEMGGQLVCITSPKEEQFVMGLCGKLLTWVGATDEAEEGKWYNADGSNAIFAKASVDNSNGMEHWLCWDGTRFNDWFSGGRCAYVCEWDR